jgi:hypothetical protein
MSKRIALGENTEWQRLRIPFASDATEGDAIQKGAAMVAAIAKALRHTGMTQSAEALQMAFELGYASAVETDDGMALEFVWPESDGA